jgi:AraC-like DNA-binding protein
MARVRVLTEMRTGLTAFRRVANKHRKREMITDYSAVESSTADHPLPERAAFWQSHVTFNHGDLHFHFRDADSFRGSTSVQRVDGFQLVGFESDSIAYSRTRQNISADGDRSVQIVIPDRGELTLHDSNGAHLLTTETGAAFSMAAPFSLTHGASSHALIFTVSDGRWPSAPLAPHAQLIGLKSGTGAIAGALLREISHHRHELDGQGFTTSSVMVSELLLNCMSGQMPDRFSTIVATAQAVIRKRSDDPAFNTAELANELGWSVRQLQAATQWAGTTPSMLIREARLTRARIRLSSLDFRDISVSDIAYGCGFGSLTAFNAAFRSAFGMRPKDARFPASQMR